MPFAQCDGRIGGHRAAASAILYEAANGVTSIGHTATVPPATDVAVAAGTRKGRPPPTGVGR